MGLVMRKPAFCICENKDADQLRGNRVFVFATRIVQSLFFLNPNFQASSHLVWQYSPVYVEPGRTPRRPVFSKRGSNKPSGLSHLYQWDGSTVIFRGVYFQFYLFLGYSCKETEKKPRWDAAFCGVTAGAILFAYVPQK